jgi:NhaP-type Na+/H+ and K+/H+ antiporter
MGIYLWIGFFGVYLWGVLACVWSASQVKRFLKRHDEISDVRVLEEFKSLVKLQMYAALVQFFVLSLGLILGILLMFTFRPLGVLAMLIVNSLIFSLSQRFVKLEKKARSLPVANENLAQEYRKVSHTWVKKPFPDF